MKNIEFGRRLQLYAGETVHNVEKAMDYLSSELVGFFVEAPLDWAAKVKVKENPTKHGTVDLSMNESKPQATRTYG